MADAVVSDRLVNNAELLGRFRTITAIIGGVVAGILGITGWVGALFFIVCHALANATLLAVTRNPQQYFVGGSKEHFTFGSLTAGALTFVFVWTIVYDAIYIF